MRLIFKCVHISLATSLSARGGRRLDAMIVVENGNCGREPFLFKMVYMFYVHVLLPRKANSLNKYLKNRFMCIMLRSKQSAYGFLKSPCTYIHIRLTPSLFF